MKTETAKAALDSFFMDFGRNPDGKVYDHVLKWIEKNVTSTSVLRELLDSGQYESRSLPSLAQIKMNFPGIKKKMHDERLSREELGPCFCCTGGFVPMINYEEGIPVLRYGGSCKNCSNNAPGPPRQVDQSIIDKAKAEQVDCVMAAQMIIDEYWRTEIKKEPKGPGNLELHDKFSQPATEDNMEDIPF